MSSFMNEPLQLQIPKGLVTKTAKSNTKKASASAKKATPIVKTSYTEIVLVEKTGVLKSLQIKEFKEEELYKKCGYKSADGFEKQTEWDIKLEGNKFLVSVYGKTHGKANGENKYDFPPPVDSTLFFGTCAIVAKVKTAEKAFDFTNITTDMWEKMYEKLFGGFEDLANTYEEDEAEIDELECVPAEKKTKHGYLKDGFVVDSECDEDDDDYFSSDDEDDDDSGSANNPGDEDDELDMENIGSELSEDGYEYSDEE